MPFVHDFGDSIDNTVIGTNKVLRMNLEGILCTKEATTSIAEQRITIGKPVFAVRQNLCCAFYFGRTAKSLFAVRFLYSSRQRKNTRQTSCLPCA
jgi:hypothetical protein